jgi:hypothetical protein
MNMTSSNFFLCLVAERTVAFKNKKPKGRIFSGVCWEQWCRQLSMCNEGVLVGKKLDVHGKGAGVSVREERGREFCGDVGGPLAWAEIACCSLSIIPSFILLPLNLCSSVIRS